MQNLPKGKLVVKHTFLEYVETPQDQRKRSFTEGALSDYRLAEFCNFYGDDLNANVRSDNTSVEEDMRLARENEELRMIQESISPERTAVDYKAPTISLASCVFVDEEFVDHCHSTDNSFEELPTENYTTVMLRNLPNLYTREMFIDLLNSEGFVGKYTFVYLPIDFKTHAGLGYAFVDMTSTVEANRLRRHFEGFAEWVIASEKRCTVSWSHPDQQGFSAHVERYRNSPVMHKSVPEEWKPVLFSGGERVSFPRANRKIRAPRIRPC